MLLLLTLENFEGHPLYVVSVDFIDAVTKISGVDMASLRIQSYHCDSRRTNNIG